MPAILDAGTMLLPSGVISANTDGAPLLIHPRTLPTCQWVISMLTPPVASATFTLSVSNVVAGTYTTIATVTWAAGQSGSRQVPIGLNSNLAQRLDNDSAWLRCSVVTVGSLTLAGS